MKLQRIHFPMAVVLAVLLIIGVGGIYNVASAEEINPDDSDVDTMSNKEKEDYYNKQNKRIQNSYEIGEPLSEEDAKIIKESAQFEADRNKLAKKDVWNFFGMGRDPSINVEGDLSGSATMETGVFNHNVKVNGSVTLVSGAATESRVRLHVVGYGVVGSDGLIGKINDFWLSSGWIDGRGATLNSSRSFTGALLYYHMDAYGQLKNGAGTLTIEDSIQEQVE